MPAPLLQTGKEVKTSALSRTTSRYSCTHRIHSLPSLYAKKYFDVITEKTFYIFLAPRFPGDLAVPRSMILTTVSLRQAAQVHGYAYGRQRRRAVA